MLKQFKDEAEWLDWRSKGIGASDVPSIMGVGFQTPYELWLEKTNKVPKRKTTMAMSQGKALEGEAIRLLEESIGKPEGYFAQQVALEHPAFPWLRCTLDGISMEDELLCEVKCINNSSTHPKTVPLKYWPQVQTQLLISGMRTALYAEYDPLQSNIWFIEVSYDSSYGEQILRECTRFWDCWQKDVAPELTKKEQKISSIEKVDLSEDPLWIEAERRYLAALQARKKLDQWLKSCEHELLTLAKERSIQGRHLDYSISYREGVLSTDYIEALRNIDLSRYRKEPVKVCSLKERK